MKRLEPLSPEARLAVFEKLEKIVDIASLTKEEREKYDESIKVYRDQLVTIAYAREKGFKEGFEEGFKKEIEKGKKKKKLEIARKMKELKIPVETIIKATDLSAEEIENFRSGKREIRAQDVDPLNFHSHLATKQKRRRSILHQR